MGCVCDLEQVPAHVSQEKSEVPQSTIEEQKSTVASDGQKTKGINLLQQAILKKLEEAQTKENEEMDEMEEPKQEAVEVQEPIQEEEEEEELRQIYLRSQFGEEDK